LNRALARSETVRNALIQWIGPKKFSEDRFDTAYSTGDETEPQVQVWVSYRPQVISKAQTVGPGTDARAADKTAAQGTPPVKTETEKNIMDKLGEGADVTVLGQTVNISMSGITKTLKKVGDLKVDANVTLTGSIGIKSLYKNWHFAGQVSPISGEWELSLSYPLDTLPPDIFRIEQIIKRGREAMGKIVEHVQDPATLEAVKKLDVKKLGDTFSPYTTPITNAIQAAQEAKATTLPGVNFGIKAGSGALPGGPILPANAPPVFHLRAVLIITF